VTARFWPKSLRGQILLAIALALLLAQLFSAVLLYRAQHERREAALVHTMAMRLFTANRELPEEPVPGNIPVQPAGPRLGPPPELFGGPRIFHLEHSPVSPLSAM
jgi:hypothetical protein